MLPSAIYYSIPTEEGVEWAVLSLRGRQLGGPSRMCAKHLRVWLQEHRAAEAVEEVETEAVAETSGPEGRERTIKEGGMPDGWD